MSRSKWLTLGIAATGLILFSPVALADHITISGYTTTATARDSWGTSIFEGQSFTITAAQPITEISTYLCPYSSPVGVISAQLFNYSSGTIGPSITTAQNTFAPGDFSCSGTDPSTYNLKTFLFTDSYHTTGTLAPGEYYIKFYAASGDNDNWNFRMSSANPYAGGTEHGYYGVGSGYDLEMQINSLTPPLHAAPVLEYPANGSTKTDNSLLFFSGTCDGSDGFSTVLIDINDTDRAPILGSGHRYVSQATAPCITGSFFISGTYGVYNGHFEAIPKSLNPDSGILGALGTANDFTVDITGNPVPPPVSGVPGCESASSITEVAVCAFSTSMQQLLTLFFGVEPGILDGFVHLSNDIKNKPPIGYLTAIISDFGSLDGSGSGSYTLSIPTELQTAIFDPLKTGIAIILWLVFGVWLLNRIRHFNFQQ
jgi:hypothetical protein